MANFAVPSAPARSTVNLTAFYGVDLTSNPSNVAITQSPNAVNMVRDEPGKVRKRRGYELKYSFDGRINGHYYRKGDGFDLIHAGDKLYRMKSTPELVYSGLNNERSHAWQFGDNLFIADGKKLLVYDGMAVKTVEESAYIPTVTIAKAPNGGGEQYDALNLLQPKFKERFLADGTSREYHLSFSGLDDANVVVRQLQSNGTWQEIGGFTCNAQTGVVSFATAPGKSPVTGEDNIEIEARRTVKGYADRINKCCIGARFGVNGAVDRLFLSGNPDFINYDWYSQKDDPTYFPDTGYSILGTNKSAIMGYSILENRLAAHKDEKEPDRNIILRSGNLVDNEATFPIYTTMQGPGSIARDTFAYLMTEPMFLTGSGIYAITPSDINAEKYSQDRSYYLNGKLLREGNLQDATCCVYNDEYWLCVNGHAYILDGLQNIGMTKNEPYSSRQYAGFYCTNIPARIMWVYDDRLWFGSNDGNVYAFYPNDGRMTNYNDNGAAIQARWDTPYLSGQRFYKNKTFKHLAVQVTDAVNSTLTVSALVRNKWNTLKVFGVTAVLFDYDAFSYKNFSYIPVASAKNHKTMHTKLRIKRVDKVMFRLENAVLNEPLGIIQVSFEFTENGNYKGE